MVTVVMSPLEIKNRFFFRAYCLPYQRIPPYIENGGCFSKNFVLYFTILENILVMQSKWIEISMSLEDIKLLEGN